MGSRRVPIVLLRRGTSLAGSGEFTTIGVNIRPFRVVQIELWRGTILGTGSPAFQMFLEGSTDGQEWEDVGGGGIDPDTLGGAMVTAQVNHRLFRLRVVLGGTNPVVSCHAVGYLSEE
jgi:hypothetical protein